MVDATALSLSKEENAVLSQIKELWDAYGVHKPKRITLTALQYHLLIRRAPQGSVLMYQNAEIVGMKRE